jgi:hypothetical protein
MNKFLQKIIKFLLIAFLLTKYFISSCAQEQASKQDSSQNKDEELYQSFKNTQWPFQKDYEERSIFDSKEFLISYNQRWGVLSLCTPDLLMVDIDDKENLSLYNKEIEKIRHYAVAKKLTFAIRQSSKGIHVFLISKRMLPNSAESIKIMNDLGGDKKYLALSRIRGFCSRIGPKVFKVLDDGLHEKLLTEEEIAKDLISKKPPQNIIGDKSLIDQGLYDKLIINDNMVKVVKKLFAENYKLMTSGKVYGFSGFIPTNFLMGKLKDKLVEEIPVKYKYGNYAFEKGPLL